MQRVHLVLLAFISLRSGFCQAPSHHPVGSLPPQGTLALQAQEKNTSPTGIGDCAYQPIDLDNPAYASKPFENPRSLNPVNGILDTDLVVTYTDPARVHIAGCGLKLRSFNGQLGGPTLRLRPGDTLRINLRNNLPSETPSEIQRQVADQTNVAHIVVIPHTFNTTNLHFHGLHVSPSSDIVNGRSVASDDVFVAVPPNSSQFYEVQVPKNHPAGTFWYHPHVHGSTALQVGSGMAGALIVEDDPSSLPKALAKASDQDHEKILIFQSILYNTNGEIDTIASFFPSPSPATPNNCKGQEGTWECSHRMTTINGQLVPVIKMKPGEVQRWRLIDAGFRDSLQLQLEDHVLHEIALDGIYTGHIDDWSPDTPPLELDPGYRSDVLVQAKPCTRTGFRSTIVASLLSSETRNQLTLDPNACVYGLWNRAVTPSQSLRGGQQRENLLAVVEVAGEPVNDQMPTADEMSNLRKQVDLPRDDIQKDVTGVQQVVFKLGQDPKASKLYFQIDGRSYDSSNIRRLPLNATEQWNITTIGDPAGLNGNPALPHVFHIHVNPFQFTRLDPSGKPELVWKDTLLIPAGNGTNSINVYTTYRDFTGRFVMHCHILDHEDLGMMEVDEVVKDVLKPMEEKAGMHQH